MAAWSDGEMAEPRGLQRAGERGKQMAVKMVALMEVDLVAHSADETAVGTAG